ncbi:MAG TPA: SlyX family protein [Pontiella sp.]
MEERIIQLESLSAMQDETIRNLHNELFEQQKELGRLRARLEQMEQKLAELAGPGPIGGNERPPHW